MMPTLKNNPLLLCELIGWGWTSHIIMYYFLNEADALEITEKLEGGYC